MVFLRRVLQHTKPSLLLPAITIVLVVSALQAQAQPSGPSPLRWGADAEGGAPFIFPDREDPGLMLGFEVDLVAALAAELKREPVFVQNQWDGLVPGLRIDNYDLVVNGLEITPDREQEINTSFPYYVSFEQLTVRKDTYDQQPRGL